MIRITFNYTFTMNDVLIHVMVMKCAAVDTGLSRNHL